MRSSFRRLASRAALALVAAPLVLGAQGGKKVLTQDSYDLWRSISQPTLSPDGKWAVYTLTPTVGDGQLVARATAGSTEHRVARGWTGRPLNSVTGTAFNVQAAQITADSRYTLFLQYPSKGAMDSSRARRARPADTPRNKLAILDLASGQVTAIERVRGFTLAREAARFVAYQIDVDTTAAGGAAGGAAGAGGRGAGAAGGAAARSDSTRPAARRKDSGAPLVLRELATGTEVRIDGVTNYTMDKNGRFMVYSTTGADSLKLDGVHVRDLATGVVTALKMGTGNYRSLSIDESATQVAFITDADEVDGREAACHALPRVARRYQGQARPAGGHSRRRRERRGRWHAHRRTWRDRLREDRRA